MRVFNYLFVLLFLFSSTISAKNYVWFDGKEAISYSKTSFSKPVAEIALRMFSDDMLQVTGFTPVEGEISKSKIVIVDLKSEDLTKNEIESYSKLGVPVKDLTEKKDAFYISVLGRGASKKLYVVGSDPRGTAYGILELSRLAGVSPWIWWGDVVPEKKNTLSISEKFSTFQSPSVEFRGIFVNDEDWTLQPWSWKHFEPLGVDGMIGPQTYKKIFQFLLRMRANAIWPGMHGITMPFYFVPGAKEIADSCGIVIGTSHCEPLMRNNVGEWDEVIRGRYNYITNKRQVQSYWIERLREVKKFENIYTIGMRGVHDGAMEGVGRDSKERAKALQEVINDQRELLKTHVNEDIESIPQQFVPYKEVLDIMESGGMEIPDDVMLTWCDDNYGYMTRLSDAQQQKRSGGAGIYYHLNYWGRPHDYMWLCAIQPGLIYNEMMEAYNNNVRRLWIVNVHDLKPVAYDLELFLDMAWDVNSVNESTLNDHLENWLRRDFGDKAGEMLLPAMLEYFRLTSIRKPEFMGWNQVELSKRVYARGWSPVSDTEFSFTEFGGELDRYIQDYDNIKKILDEAEKYISEDRKDAFFGQVKYQIYGAAAMATKMLEAQRARTIAAQIPESEWKNSKELLTASAKSLNAFNEIQELTDYYNYEMSDGKWKHSMCYKPRDLYVFRKPNVPLDLDKEEIEKYSKAPIKKVPTIDELKETDYVVFNASSYTKASKNVKVVQNLGHSMGAVSIPKGESITFDFDAPFEGDVTLRMAVIPTHPMDKGDVRYSIKFNNEEERTTSFRQRGRTSRWKLNVLRGQAVYNTEHKVKKGKQSLTITAVDDHVLIDQWMLDTNKDREFYVFPVMPKYN